MKTVSTSIFYFCLVLIAVMNAACTTTSYTAQYHKSRTAVLKHQKHAFQHEPMKRKGWNERKGRWNKI